MQTTTRLLVVLTLMAAFVATGTDTGAAQGAAAASGVEIDVVGQGAVHATPDVARLTLGVEAYGPSVAPAVADVDQRIASMVRALRSAGVAESHIRTAELEVQPQYDTRDGQPMQLRGYIVRNMVEIETTDVSGVPALVDAAIASGVNRIDAIHFESLALTQLQNQARELAWQSARVKAEQLAQKAGRRLASVVRVEEPLVEAISTVHADPSADTPVASGRDQAWLHRGDIEVRAQVRVVWSATP